MLSDAPSCATSSAICSAFRVVVPSSSMAAAKLARPGLSSGFASLPVRSTRFAATIGRPRRSFRMQRQTVRQRRRLPAWPTAADAPGPGFGISLRHGSSALIDSLLRRQRPAPRAASASAPARAARLSGHDVHHDARRRGELVARKRLQRGRRDAAIALHVLLEIVRRAEDSGCSVLRRSAMPPKPPSRSRPPMMSVSIRVARALDLRVSRPAFVRSTASSSSIAFSSSSAVWPGRAVASIWKIEPEHQRLLLRRHVLRDLLFVDELLVQTARASATEDRRERCPRRRLPA